MGEGAHRRRAQQDMYSMGSACELGSRQSAHSICGTFSHSLLVCWEQAVGAFYLRNVPTLTVSLLGAGSRRILFVEHSHSHCQLAGSRRAELKAMW